MVRARGLSRVTVGLATKECSESPRRDGSREELADAMLSSRDVVSPLCLREPGRLPLAFSAD